RDITQRLRMEQTVRESEARYRMLFETIPHGIREVDLSGRIVACNPAYERMLEYGPGELIGRSMLDLLADEDRDRVQSMLERVAAEHPAPQPYVVRTLTKSGRVIEGEVTWNYVRDDRGSVTGMVAVVTDVTDRKRAERAVADEQRLLRQMLDLYERDRQLLAYEIHDGAAQHVTGALFHLQGFEQLRTTNPAAAEESIARARQSLTEAAGEIRRLIGGLRPPILDESGVVAAVEHLVDESRRAGGAEIEIVQDVRFERLATPVENTIFRIVQEGLTNARRYSQSDRIRVSLVQNNGTVHVEIRDWGVGFDPNKVSRSRFGLRGIRERARLLGGKAEISSQPGEGTRIKVELPCVLPGEESGSEE
ncbi:MAG: PAS domain S-box protein, partial [Thermoguttaceae bacterium]|nr:PAS domain S-box protein [Thermoguttaceae bacterium]